MMKINAITFCAAVWSVLTGFAAMPELEPCFTSQQIEKGAPKLVWTKNEDGSETTLLAEKDAGLDLSGVKLTRRTFDTDGRREVVYTLENLTKDLRYASLVWRSVCKIAADGGLNYLPTTENVLDLSIAGSMKTGRSDKSTAAASDWSAVPKPKSGIAPSRRTCLRITAVRSTPITRRIC